MPGDPAVVRDYRYDGDGLRAVLLWDSTGDLPLVLGDSAGLYVTGPDGLSLTQLTFDGEQRYYHHDQLGSTRAITNTAGTVTARYTFDPYGNPAAGSSTVDSRFGYAGQYTDRQSGLIYMRARWYDPAAGQFITSDPIGMASGETNLYRYAGGDPANRVDPSGLLDLGIIDIGLPSGADVSNFFAGFGDTATFGITKQIRGALGIDYVDYCSSAYGYGGNLGAGIEIATGVVGAAKVAGKIGYRELGRRLADETGSIRIPGRPYRGRNAPDAWWREQGIPRGISRGQVRTRLHAVKDGAKPPLGATDDVVIGRTGDVHDPRTGERLGSLTSRTN